MQVMGVWDDKTLNASMPIEDYGLDVLKGAHIVVPLVGARRACACACVRVRRAWPGRHPKKHPHHAPFRPVLQTLTATFSAMLHFASCLKLCALAALAGCGVSRFLLL